MKMSLKPIRPKRISDQVFDQLRELIFQGDFQPGQQIMTERELAEALNVSRNSVREAINKLVTLRFLEQRQGQGTFVRSIDETVQIPLATVMETQATLIDLLEIRMGIECTAAALAARRITAAELETIEGAIADMEQDTRAGGLGSEGDIAFHMAIATATKNPLQIYIMKNVSEFLHMGIRENLLHLYQDAKNIDTIISQHRAILEAIRSRDAEGAFTAMRHHITFVIDFFNSRQ